MTKQGPRNPTRRGAVRRNILVALSLLVASIAPIGADTFSVGPACAHTTLSSAVLAAWLTPGDDLIKVTAPLTSQSPIFDDFEPSVRGKVTVRGGYTSCGDATASGRTTVDGVTSQAVVRVQTSTQSESRVILENLELSGGARGVSVTDGGHLTLNNVLITLNEGGGAFVGSGATLVTNASSELFQNGWNGEFTPTTGGGIDCFGGHLDLQGRVSNNRAELGAGLAMLSGCTAELRPGFILDANQASSNGGGVYLAGPGALWGNGAGNAIQLVGNHANRGGGIYAAGAGAVVALQDSAFSGNGAAQEGGAIYALVGPEIHLLRGSGCTTGFPCNRLAGNYLSTNLEGSVVYAWDALVVLRQQRVEGNQTDFIPTMQPSLFYMRGASGELWLENLQLWDNRAAELVRVVGGASFVGGYLSSAHNRYGVSSGGTANSYFSVDTASGAVYSSILWDHQGFFLTGPAPSLVADCLIVSTTLGVPLGSVFISTADPQFLDANGGNLHLPASSPAVDYCDEAVYPWPGGPDFDGEARNVDHPANPNGSPGVGGGRFDIGFDEVPSSVVPEIFSDDFESGTPGEWSLAVP